MLDPTLAGKKEFIYHGLPVSTIVTKLNEASEKKNSEMYKFWVRKMNLEVAKAMFHLNIHHWKHFESCFKSSKKNKIRKLKNVVTKNLIGQQRSNFFYLLQ